MQGFICPKNSFLRSDFLALFRIYRSDEGSLSVTMTDGYAYFCLDTGNFFIDYKDNDGRLQRIYINSDYAKHLRSWKRK